MSELKSVEHCSCGISVGELVADFSSDEGPGSQYDLLADFADDESFALYAAHHDEAKFARNALRVLAGHITVLRDQQSNSTVL